MKIPSDIKTLFEEALQLTDGDKQAAAILVLASVIPIVGSFGTKDK